MASQEAVAAAYEGSLLYGEHNWGFDAKRFPRLYGEAWRGARAEGKYDALERSWAEHGAYIRKTEQLVRPALAANMNALARAVNVDGLRLVVFNPLPWRRDDVVSIEAPQLARTGLVDVASGNRLRMEFAKSTLRFVARDIRRSANHEIFCLAGGLTATGPDGIGVGLCPIDAPLVSLGRRGLLRYSREFGTRKPVVFVNLYNVWGTNFQQWIGGSWSSRVRLWAVDGNGTQNELVSRSWDARSRTKVAVFDGPAGPLAPSQAGLELSRPGVLVTAFGANPDGDGQVLRLWEQVGRSGICRIRLPDRLRTAHAQPCHLRGRPQGQPIPVRDGWIEVPLTRFAPASVLLRNERKTRND